jgi:hypothetical protein
MVIKRPEPGANICPHVVPKATKSEGIHLLPLCLHGIKLKELATVTNLQSDVSIHIFLFIPLNLLIFFLSFISFAVLQLMLPEAPQPYGLLYYPRTEQSNFLHQFRAATSPKQRKLEL